MDTGVLYRTGPGSFSTPLKEGSTDPSEQLHIGHWFDGFTQNHRFTFERDETTSEFTIKYNSRHSTDGKKAKIAKLGYEVAGGFSQTNPPRNVWGSEGKPKFNVPPSAVDPKTGIQVEKLMAIGALQQRPQQPRTQDANVGVTIEPRWPGKNSAPFLVTRTDANILQSLDPETLEPLETFDWSKFDHNLTGQVSASHSQVDAATEEEFNFILSLGPAPRYKVFKAKGTVNPKITILAEITDAPPCHLHSFFLSKMYVILGVWQAVYKHGGIEVALNGNVASGIDKEWNPSLPAIFYVIDREGKKGVIKRFHAPAHYCFHTICAYEEGDDIVLSYCKLDGNAPIWKFQLKYLRSLPRSFTDCTTYYARARLPNVSVPGPPGQLIFEHMGCGKHNMELPQINPGHYMSPYRYVFGIHSQDLNSFPFHGLIRYDTNKDTPEDERALVWAPEHIFAGEPLFLRDPSLPPSPDSKTELQGLILTMVFDATAQASGLVALNPATMKEVARAMMPRGTIASMGFHGSFTRNEFAFRTKV